MRVKYKKRLIESDANPLDLAVADASTKDLVKEALLKAVASESSAICEYDQLLTLIADASDALKNKEKIQNTVEDLKHEEEKHLAQLNETLKLFDDLADGLNAGQEEATTGEDKTNVKESVLTEAVTEKVTDNTRAFDSDTIFEIILDNFNPTDNAETALYRLFSEHEDLTAEEVDEKLETVKQILNISPEHMEALEQLIVETKDPKAERIKEFEEDIESDSSYIETISENVTTIAAYRGLMDIIEHLKEISYDGSSNSVWEISQLDKLGPSDNKRIIS